MSKKRCWVVSITDTCVDLVYQTHVFNTHKQAVTFLYLYALRNWPKTLDLPPSRSKVINMFFDEPPLGDVWYRIEPGEKHDGPSLALLTKHMEATTKLAKKARKQTA